MYTLFISDLHLKPEAPQTINTFTRLLQDSKDAEAIYILGDFVEYWIGDDDEEHGLNVAFAAIRNITDLGVPIYLMHGNRDFLIGPRFAEQCNITLLADPTIIDIYGEKALLMHGDTLCTDDIEYQKFRSMVRNPEWQAAFLEKPLEERRAIVHNLRETSRQATDDKTDSIMDVNQLSVSQAMQNHQAQLLIHGHTHRPARHAFVIDNKQYQRWVLGDWHKEAKILRFNEKGPKFQTIEIMK